MNSALLNHYRELLALVDGDTEKVLDVGCGSNDVLKLALRELPTLELAVGIERNHRRTQQALSGAPPLPIYMLADGEQLPFSNAAFDVVLSIDALEYTSDPVRFLMESRRVCKAGGRVLAVHGDWDTVVFSSLDEERGRRILRGFCDTGPSGWMGRNVPGLMREAGFADVECRVSVILEQEYREGTHGHFTADVIRQWLEASKSVPPREVAAWMSELEELSRAGRYLFSANRYVCVGRR